MKIALTIPTGRPRVKEVVRAFIENAIQHGHDSKDFSIYLSIDTEYQNTCEEDFYLDKETLDKIRKVEYITEEKRKILGNAIKKRFNVPNSLIDKFFVGNGYSKQRNASLLFALIDKNDFAICFDDDEAPFIPVKKTDGSIEWTNLDFFGPHIRALSSGTDVTRGPCLGYLSPIPSDFEKNIPKEIRKKLGQALQYGNDVITKNSFLNLMSKIRYLDENDADKESFVVKEGKHGKHIYAGNMGINLDSFKKGRIPLFYTPPNARGEDTIFALQLADLEVKEVNSFIFHDPFCLYPQILDGDFPEFLMSIPVTSETKERFADALIGWLKYAPILIHMTSKTEKEKNQRLNEMLSQIGSPTQQLADILECSKISSCERVLFDYSKNAKNHFMDLDSLQKTWKKNFSTKELSKLIVPSNDSI
ncbi:MAG TPA: hypothetical protein ENH99_01160 [Candidatus Pacearchaeota archaeon]|nr:hypothetical protein [Candidatus Pacearchaeota archaeon]